MDSTKLTTSPCLSEKQARMPVLLFVALPSVLTSTALSDVGKLNMLKSPTTKIRDDK